MLGANPTFNSKYNRETGAWDYKGKPKPFRGSDTPSIKHGFGIYPIEAPPLAIQAQLGVKMGGTWLLPGINVQADEGVFHIDLLDRSKVRNELQPRVKSLKSKIEVDRLEFFINMMAGPKFSAALAHSFSMGLPNKFNPTREYTDLDDALAGTFPCL